MPQSNRYSRDSAETHAAIEAALVYGHETAQAAYERGEHHKLPQIWTQTLKFVDDLRQKGAPKNK